MSTREKYKILKEGKNDSKTIRSFHLEEFYFLFKSASSNAVLCHSRQFFVTFWVTEFSWPRLYHELHANCPRYVRAIAISIDAPGRAVLRPSLLSFDDRKRPWTRALIRSHVSTPTPTDSNLHFWFAESHIKCHRFYDL